jgi:hypothetical protein
MFLDAAALQPLRLLQQLQRLNVVDGIVLIVGVALTATGVRVVAIMVLAEIVEL